MGGLDFGCGFPDAVAPQWLQLKDAGHDPGSECYSGVEGITYIASSRVGAFLVSLPNHLA